MKKLENLVSEYLDVKVRIIPMINQKGNYKYGLYRAILDACDSTYHMEFFDGQYISCDSLVKKLKNELYNSFTINYYHYMLGGSISKLAQKEEQYSYEILRKTLITRDNSIGIGMLQYISDQLNVDVYILYKENDDEISNNAQSKISQYYHCNRDSIIVYLEDNQYYLVAVRIDYEDEDDHKYHTLFKSDNLVITRIKDSNNL